jgi:3-keto-disaccharide hydrolase
LGRGRRALRLSLSGVLIVLSSFGAVDGAKKKTDGKWIELFNGKDTTGWRMAGKGNFTVEDGALQTHGGMGMLWYEGRKFANFTLRVEWKVNDHCNNSGIFVRFPEKSDDPWFAVNNGYEIQIDDCDKKGLMFQTGSIYSFHPATKLASRPAGEWNVYEITVVAQHYTIVLNGEKVNEFDGKRGMEGYVGLQNHDPISRVSFRSVKVKEIR